MVGTDAVGVLRCCREPKFHAEKQEFAAVVEGRSVVGVVTATDTFEAITGEVEDPMDAVAVEPGSGDV